MGQKYNIKVGQMQPRTPQKKKSVQAEGKHEVINNSYIFSLPNNSNIMQSNQSSIFADHNHLKSSHHSINASKNNKIHNPNNKISLVRKYVQQELQTRNKYAYTSKEPKQSKEYREVVISDQFVRSHHLYKMLKEQMAIADARHERQTTTLNQVLQQCEGETKEAKDYNHQLKVELWEYKTQLMELKSMLQEEQEDNKKLVEEYEQACRYRQGEEAEGDEGDEGEDEEGQYDEQGQGGEEQGQNKGQIMGEQNSNEMEKFEGQQQKAQKQSHHWKSQKGENNVQLASILRSVQKNTQNLNQQIEIWSEQHNNTLPAKQQMNRNVENGNQ